MSENSDLNNRYWEQYLVRYFVPTIIAGLCIGFLLLHNKLGFIGITNSEQTKSITQILNTFKDKVNIYLCIGFALVSFAYVYVVSGISMAIHVCLPTLLRYVPNEFWKFKANIWVKLGCLGAVNAYYIIPRFGLLPSCITNNPSIKYMVLLGEKIGIFTAIDNMFFVFYIICTLSMFIEYKAFIKADNTDRPIVKKYGFISLLFFVSLACLISGQNITAIMVVVCLSIVSLASNVYDYYKYKYKNDHDKFLTTAKHLKEHGASFQNSLLVIFSTILIYSYGANESDSINITDSLLTPLILLLVLGSFYGTIIGAYIEARHLKENSFEGKVIKHPLKNRNQL